MKGLAQLGSRSLARTPNIGMLGSTMFAGSLPFQNQFLAGGLVGVAMG